MFHVSSCSWLWPIHWSQKLSRERRQAMLQLHLSDQQVYCLLRCGLYWRFDSTGHIYQEVSNIHLLSKIMHALQFRHVLWRLGRCQFFHILIFSRLISLARQEFIIPVPVNGTTKINDNIATGHRQLRMVVTDTPLFIMHENICNHITDSRLYNIR